MSADLGPRGAFVPSTQGLVHSDTRRRLAVEEQRPLADGDGHRWCLTGCGWNLDPGVATGLWVPFPSGVRLRQLTATVTGGMPAAGAFTILRTGAGVATVNLPGGASFARATIPVGEDGWWRPADTVQFLFDVVPSWNSGSTLTKNVVIQAWFDGRGGGSLVFPARATPFVAGGT